MIELNRVAIPGSDRAVVRGAHFLAAAHPDDRVEVSVRIRAQTPHPPAGSFRVDRDAYVESYGALPEDIAAIEAFAHEHGLTVAWASRARRTVGLSGTAQGMYRAFGTQLAHYALSDRSGTYRGRIGPVQIPKSLEGIIEGVFGLDDRPQARPHFRLRQGFQPHLAGASYTPQQVAQLYDFPAGLDGSGQCIALIELGGGYRTSDLQAYFAALKLPAPSVTAISVDGALNHPAGDPNSADGEVVLDIEIAAAVASRARLAVYFAPNTDRGFLDAITAAIHDTDRKPSVVSISWGSSENNWTPQAMKAFDDAFAAGAALGVTICVASGDHGSSDGETDGKPHVDFPASSPHVLACGGTRLTGAGSAISSEAVWNDNDGWAGGGGFSAQFDRPAWQLGIHSEVGRGVPDIAGNADPHTGYQIRVDGSDVVSGGTSAVAPLWAGLIALFNQRLAQPVGFLNIALYSNRAALHDIKQGSNGLYQASAGWDACTGLGSPDGARILAVLEAAAPAASSEPKAVA